MPKVVTEGADVLPALGEVFREHGFEGASLSVIGKRTGLGKGSLYHFFPGGKEEMAAAVLTEIDGRFQAASSSRFVRKPTPRAPSSTCSLRPSHPDVPTARLAADDDEEVRRKAYAGSTPSDARVSRRPRAAPCRR